MNEKTKTIGIDGREYDSSTARVLGDRHALMERQMAEDIQNQNRLIQENMQLQQEIANQNYRLEMQKEENRKSEAEKQREHDKEMRLLKLFDEVGISKKTYDTYINHSYKNKYLDERWQASENITDLELLLDGTFSLDNIKDAQLKSKIESILGDNPKSTEDYLIDETYELKQKRKKHCIYSALIYVGGFSISCIGVLINSDSLFGIGMLSAVVGTIYLVTTLSKYNNKIMRNEELIKYSSVDYSKYSKQLNNLIEKEEKRISSLDERYKKEVEPIIDDFYSFRINHYNPKIEKLLDDVGYSELIKQYGFKLKSINNSNKKKDGTIEDYIEYFETHS